MMDIDYTYADGNWCPDCGLPRSVCDCENREEDGMSLNEWQDWMEEEQESRQCGCPYCFCSNLTIAGETCSECLSGAHQG